MRRALAIGVVVLACGAASVSADRPRAIAGPTLQVRVIDPAATTGPYDLFRRTHVRHLLAGRAISVSPLPIVLEPAVLEAAATEDGTMEIGVEDAQPLPPVAGAPFAGPSIALGEGDQPLVTEGDTVAVVIHEQVGDRTLDAVLVALGHGAAGADTLGPSLARALALAGDRPLIVGAAIGSPAPVPTVRALRALPYGTSGASTPAEAALRDGSCREVPMPAGLRCAVDRRGGTGTRGDACECEGVFLSDSTVSEWWQEHAVWPLREELGVELSGWALTLRAPPPRTRDRAGALGDPRLGDRQRRAR